MIICLCKSLNERQLRESIASGADSFDALQFETGVSTCCGTCTDTVHALLERHAGGALASTELRRAVAA
ncbi:MAG: bacterioferritin-associated ferredoxin [Gammaproteobacteria bacterium]